MPSKVSGYSNLMKSIGPGLLWAGAAIGVSHLVQSTRAGAGWGFSLAAFILFANVVKYPFFEFGPRYAAAMDESLLDGYQRQGRWAVWVYFILTLAMMCTIQAAVTIVTAGLAAKMTGLQLSPQLWSLILLTICALIMHFGRYPLLDLITKVIIVALAVSTIAAVIVATLHGPVAMEGFSRPNPYAAAAVPFLAALMGWMPSAFDIAVWNSMWTLARREQTGHKPTVRESLIDFNIGYIATTLLALGFLSLGALVMFGTSEPFASAGPAFAAQLVSLYTRTLGAWSYPIITIAAFTTMFSTTLTVTDGFPRSLLRATEIIFPPLIKDNREKLVYNGWMALLIGGALLLQTTLRHTMTVMVDIATTLSFVSAPVLAYLNYRAVTGPWMPPDGQPRMMFRWFSLASLVVLSGLSIGFLYWKYFIS